MLIGNILVSISDDAVRMLQKISESKARWTESSGSSKRMDLEVVSAQNK